MTRVSIRDADFDADRAAIRQVRFAVFVDEQRVPAHLEMDTHDAHCLHVLALDGSRAVGTGRLDPASGKIGRVAVLAPWRRQGVGRALMAALHARAVTKGLDKVWCNAQVSALPFYIQLGYEVSSSPFLEAGIEHVRAQRTLQQAVVPDNLC